MPKELKRRENVRSERASQEQENLNKEYTEILKIKN